MQKILPTWSMIASASIPAGRKPELVKIMAARHPEKSSARKEGGKRVRGELRESTPEKPLLTVITVVFNNVETIEHCILSVLEQTYDNIEYIIVDGGSTDGTLDILGKYEDRIDYWMSEKDAGIYDAMNKGIDLASGIYVGMLNSDDYLTSPSVLEDIVRCFRAHQTDSVFSCLNIVDRSNTDKVLRRFRFTLFRPGLIRFGIVPPHPTLYCKRAVYEKVGRYRTDYRVAADFEMMLRMFVVAKITWYFLDEATVNMRAGGISNNGLAGQIHQNMEIVRACRENGVYTNIFLIALKLPVKFFQTITARIYGRSG